MKTITITIDEDGAVHFSTENFINDFEINGLLQTMLMHRVCNQFGLTSNQNVEEKLKE